MSLKKLLELHQSDNIADTLDDDELLRIGNKVKEEFDLDKKSRGEWEDLTQKAMKIVNQVYETKTTPWPNASNIKYPLITTAVIQHASRAYPEVVRGGRIVNVAAGGPDPQGLKKDRAERLAKHMSYQLLVESDTWEAGLDKLLHMLPVLGTVFKKTYYNPLDQTVCSDVCSPQDVVINDTVRSMNTARRISHVIYLHGNDLLAGMAMGIYKEYDLCELEPDNKSKDEDRLIEFIEQHRFLDLDGDGYQEPYIVTIHMTSRKVIRIKARWDMAKVKLNSKDKVISIPAIQYFTDYHYIPSPDGSFYSIGFGTLLYPINESVNTLLNQLVDAGTLNNLQGGFIAEGFRIKGGTIKAKMGEYTQVSTANGGDIKNNIVPFPTKEPSPVLFQLLGMLIQVGKEVSSVNDSMMGQQEAQNAPATSVLSLISQGLKVFNSIQKRLNRGLTSEFRKIFDLNKEYLDQRELFKYAGQEVAIYKADYMDDSMELTPVADPNMSSDMQRLARVNSLMQTMQLLSPAGRQYAMMMYLKELDLPDVDIKGLTQPSPPPPPNPELMKIQVDAQKDHVLAQIEAGKLDLEKARVQIHSIVEAAKAEKLKADAILDIAKAAQATEQFKIQAMIDLIDKIDPEGGVSMNAIKPYLDELQRAGGTNDNTGTGGAMAQPSDNQAPIPAGGGNPPGLPG
jgi:chaperonin GroES